MNFIHCDAATNQLALRQEKTEERLCALRHDDATGLFSS